MGKQKGESVKMAMISRTVKSTVPLIVNSGQIREGQEKLNTIRVSIKCC